MCENSLKSDVAAREQQLIIVFLSDFWHWYIYIYNILNISVESVCVLQIYLHNLHSFWATETSRIDMQASFLFLLFFISPYWFNKKFSRATLCPAPFPENNNVNKIPQIIMKMYEIPLARFRNISNLRKNLRNRPKTKNYFSIKCAVCHLRYLLCSLSSKIYYIL